MAELLIVKRRRQTQSMSLPVELTCPFCGMAIDLWPVSRLTAVTHCEFCGFQPYSHEKTLN